MSENITKHAPGSPTHSVFGVSFWQTVRRRCESVRAPRKRAVLWMTDGDYIHSIHKRAFGVIQGKFLGNPSEQFEQHNPSGNAGAGEGSCSTGVRETSYTRIHHKESPATSVGDYKNSPFFMITMFQGGTSVTTYLKEAPLCSSHKVLCNINPEVFSSRMLSLWCTVASV